MGKQDFPRFEFVLTDSRCSAVWGGGWGLLWLAGDADGVDGGLWEVAGQQVAHLRVELAVLEQGHQSR